MKVNDIFGVVNEVLYTVQYDFHTVDDEALSEIFRHWTDIEYLEQYFHKYEKELRTFWPGTTPLEAAMETIKEAKAFRKKLVALASGDYAPEDLEDLFHPIHEKNPERVFIQSKAYGGNQKTWLRLYGIRLDYNRYMISGGVIKLTKANQEMEEIQQEMEKLVLLRQYLIDNDIEFL